MQTVRSQNQIKDDTNQIRRNSFKINLVKAKSSLIFLSVICFNGREASRFCESAARHNREMGIFKIVYTHF